MGVINCMCWRIDAWDQHSGQIYALGDIIFLVNIMVGVIFGSRVPSLLLAVFIRNTISQSRYNRFIYIDLNLKPSLVTSMGFIILIKLSEDMYSMCDCTTCNKALIALLWPQDWICWCYNVGTDAFPSTFVQQIVCPSNIWRHSIVSIERSHCNERSVSRGWFVILF